MDLPLYKKEIARMEYFCDWFADAVTKRDYENLSVQNFEDAYAANSCLKYFNNMTKNELSIIRINDQIEFISGGTGLVWERVFRISVLEALKQDFENHKNKGT